VAADVAIAWRHIKLYIDDTCAILTPIMLLLHKQIHLTDGICWRIVLIDVVLEGLSQPHHGYTTFVLDSVAHAVFGLLCKDMVIDKVQQKV
jgi:hypothetical protein